MIVVTAPTGRIGREVVQNLLSAGAPVRVVVRDPSRLTQGVATRAEVVAGSHGDPEVVERALDGAQTLFWLVPPDPQAADVMSAYVDFSRPAVEAVRRHGVTRIVTVSALGRGSTLRSGYVEASLRMDDLMAGSGAHLRALTMPSFMDNLLRQATSIAARGLFFSPIPGDLALPSVATRDVAAVAADLLSDPSWTGRDDVPVLGPEDLSFDDMAETMSTVLDRTVRFQQISGEAYLSTLVAAGMSGAMAQGMLDMAVAKANGIDTLVGRDGAARTPTTFREWTTTTLLPALST